VTAAILGAGGAHNPQAEQMAGESMRRTLAAQAAAIWQQERGLFRRYALPQRARIADVGTGTDAKIGRRTLPLLQKLGLVDLSVDYVVVDTQRVPRATFAAILTAWRDGFAATIADHSGLARTETRALFDGIVTGILDPDQYAVWQVPIVSGRRPVCPTRKT
jgi:hypothetical protein